MRITAAALPEVVQLSASIGAEIRNVDLTTELPKSAIDTIHDALMEHETVMFRNQAISSEQHLAFGARFGELSIHPFSPNRPEMQEMIVLDNDGSNQPLSTDVWHSDEMFRADPPLGTILRADIVPPLGGDTLFASMTAAYEGLSDHMQQLIADLDAVHDFLPWRRLFTDSAESREKLRDMEDRYPKASHPVVRVHPVTGRKALFVSSQFTLRINGMREMESRHVLNILFDQAKIPEYQMRVKWQPNTMVFWDNRSVQHYATHDYLPHRRRMERVTIKGDVPFGIAAAPAELRQTRFGSKRSAADLADSGGQAESVVRDFERL